MLYVITMDKWPLQITNYRYGDNALNERWCGHGVYTLKGWWHFVREDWCRGIFTFRPVNVFCWMQPSVICLLAMGSSVVSISLSARDKHIASKHDMRFGIPQTTRMQNNAVRATRKLPAALHVYRVKKWRCTCFNGWEKCFEYKNKRVKTILTTLLFFNRRYCYTYT